MDANEGVGSEVQGFAPGDAVYFRGHDVDVSP